MDDLIFRSAAIDALLKQPNTPTPSVIRRVLRQVPEVDAVEVVRCKDCEHWNEDDDVGYCNNPDGLDNYAKPDDFCSYGERREDNAAD